MKTSKILSLLLLAAGAVGIFVGGAILLVPAAFHGTSGIVLGKDASLLSEVRASGGALLAMGMLVAAGAFVHRLAFTATVVSALIYLSYGLSRIVGMALDGMPHASLVVVAAAEIFIGTLCALALGRWRTRAMTGLEGGV